MNPLENIGMYNQNLLLSQVVDFFERRNIFLTKTAIQNYVRIGLLPKPLGGRYYTRGHLIILVMIDKLKECFSLEEIKAILNSLGAAAEDTGALEYAYNLFVKLADEDNADKIAGNLGLVEMLAQQVVNRRRIFEELAKG